MRIIPLVLTALALAGCPEMTKHVPDDALADVPPEQVEGLAALDRQIAELADGPRAAAAAGSRRNPVRSAAAAG